MTILAGQRRAGTVAGQPGPEVPAARLARLLDPGSMTPLCQLDGSGAVTVSGRIDGAQIVAYCTDPGRMGGALGSAGCAHIAAAIGTAMRERCPVIGIWQSGGARLAEGVESLDGMGQMFASMIAASGRIPQISVVAGPAAGGAAYGPALTDIVIMSPAGRLFVTGPDVVRSVTGEQVDMEGLGGAAVHGKKSGVAHVVASDEDDGYRRARQLTCLLARPGRCDPGTAEPDEGLRELMPDQPRRAYDVRPLVRRILDSPAGLHELQPKWAPNILTGLGRLGGATVGVIANNPLHKGGCLDSVSAEKAARFVRMCDAFGVPLIVLVDAPGYLPGVSQEWDGIVRRGAKLLHAFGEAVTPRVTLVTRKSIGGAYIAMNSRSLGATAVFAWPAAEVAVMGATAAVGILHRRELAAAPENEREALRERLAAEHARTAGGLARAVDLGAVNEVIDPAETRHKLMTAIAAAPSRRGTHGNIAL